MLDRQAIPFDELHVGDSFVYADSQYPIVRYWEKVTGRSAQVRSQGDDPVPFVVRPFAPRTPVVRISSVGGRLQFVSPDWGREEDVTEYALYARA